MKHGYSILITALKRKLLCRLTGLMLLTIPFVAIGQTPTTAPAPTEQEKTKFIGKIGHWLTAYGMSTDDFMEIPRNNFKASSYAEVYIEGIIDHKAWMFTMLNKVTEFRHLQKQSPYVLFKLKFNPTDDNLNNYEVSLTLETSSDVNVSLDKVVSDAAAKYLTGKKYTEPSAATNDVAKTLQDCFSGISAKLGKQLAPDMMVSYNNEVFWDGHEILMLATEGNTIELEAIDKDGKALKPSEIKWTNADPFQSKGVVDMTGVTTKVVKLEKGDKSLSVTVKRISLQDDINELLKKMIVEVLTSKKKTIESEIANLKQDSISNARNMARRIAILESGNFPMENNGAQLSPMFLTPIKILDSASFMADTVRVANFNGIRKRKHIHNTIRRKVNLVAFADLVVEKPEKLKNLFEELLKHSGSLIAQLALSKDSDGKGDAARNIVVDFLNKNLERISGVGSVNLPDKSLEQQLSSISQSAIRIESGKYLYVNNFVADKQKIETRLKDYLENLAQRGTPLYVFVNYSQDISTESYLSRVGSLGGRPVGLPEGAHYKVFTLVNIPGSVIEQGFELDGSPESQTTGTFADNAVNKVLTPGVEDFIAELKTKAKELYGDTQGQIYGFAYCKKCATDKTGMIQDLEIPGDANTTVYIGKQFKCFGILYPSAQRKASGSQTEPEIFNNVKKINEWAEAVGVNSGEQLLLALRDDPNNFFNCTGALQNQLANWDYCVNEPSSAVVNKLDELLRECLALKSTPQGTTSDALKNIINYTSSAISTAVATDINALAIANAKGLNSLIYVTDNTTEANRATEITNRITAGSKTEMVVWLNIKADKTIELKKIHIGESSIKDRNGVNISASIKELFASVTGAFSSLTIKTVTSLFDGLGGLINTLQIPEKYWNADSKFKDPLTGESYDDTFFQVYRYAHMVANLPTALVYRNITVVGSPADQLEFAAVCGFYNSFIGLLSSFPEGVSFIIKVITNQDDMGKKCLKIFDQLEVHCAQNNPEILIPLPGFTEYGYAKCAWQAIQKHFTTGNDYQIAYKSGGAVFQIVTVVIAFTKAGTVARIAEVIDIMDPISLALRGLIKIVKPIYAGGRLLYRSGSRYITILLENGKYVMRLTQASGEILTGNLPDLLKWRLVIDATGNKYVVGLYLDDAAMDGIVQGIRDAKRDLNVLSDPTLKMEGRSLAEVTLKGGGEQDAVIAVVGTYDDLLGPVAKRFYTQFPNASDDLVEQFNKLNDTYKDDFLKDLETSAGTSLRGFFSGNPQTVDVWKIFKNANLSDAIRKSSTNIERLSRALKQDGYNAVYFENLLKSKTDPQKFIDDYVSRLGNNGKFVDNGLETDYTSYLSRKAKEGKPPRDRSDWNEASDYMKYNSPTARGNRFNDIGKFLYDINELNLELPDGSFVRIDSYVPPTPTSEGMIISRKATDLIDIGESTFRKHLQEMKTKYSPGTKIHSNKFPDIGEAIQGKQYLQIPESNKSFYDIERYKKIARDEYGIEVIFLAE